MYCPFFAPYYFKYTLPDNHQLEMLNRYNEYHSSVKDETVPHTQPIGWSCEVETSFAVKSEVKPSPLVSNWQDYDPLNVNQVLQFYIFETAKQLNWPVNNYVINTWYNCYGKDHYQENHDHIPHMLSGIYFLSYDNEIHGSLRFQNPFSEKLRYAMPQKMWNMMGNKSIYLEEEQPIVSSGDLILFPSWLKHRVTRISQDLNPKAFEMDDSVYPKRITISFNVDFYDWFDEYPNTLANISRI